MTLPFLCEEDKKVCQHRHLLQSKLKFQALQLGLVNYHVPHAIARREETKTFSKVEARFEIFITRQVKLFTRIYTL